MEAPKRGLGAMVRWGIALSAAVTVNGIAVGQSTTPTRWGSYTAPSAVNPQPNSPHAAPPAGAGSRLTGNVAHASVARASHLPPDLFAMPDSRTLQIGGHTVSVGDLKRRLTSALSAKPRTATRTTISRSMTTHPSQASPNWGSATSTNALWTGVHGRMSPRATPQNPATAPAGPPHGTPANLIPATQAGVAAMLCRNSPPRIRSVGPIVSGANFLVQGDCFGQQLGAVEIAGNLPNGRIEAPILQWRMGAILAQMPPVSGYGDGVVTVTVVSGAGTRSADTNGRFQASKQRVDVSSHWQPSSHYLHYEVDPVVHENWGPAPSLNFDNAATFQLAVNPMCALDTMQVTMRHGQYLEQSGFENGPPNASTTTVHVRESCLATETSTDILGTYVSSSYSDAACVTEYDLQAYAYCPVGVTP
ncbi:MAG: hypothetical protein KGL92_11410 [Gammaproteobacteria bacterium]|nr:hypothetical protein [Gammaproteobacteria bacterium]